MKSIENKIYYDIMRKISCQINDKIFYQIWKVEKEIIWEVKEKIEEIISAR